MKLRSVLLAAVVLLACSPSVFAAGCSKGVGSSAHSLWDGYVVQIGPAPQPAGSCRAVLLAPDGNTVFEVTGVSAVMNPATGNDINNDGKRDAVLETDAGPDQCCHVYSIVTPGENPALQRQFSTSVELNFGDRDGDGKIEAWAHDFAFQGFDHLLRDQSPAPLVVFRLRGNTLYNVSPAFWADYQADINQAQSMISSKALDKFTGVSGTSPSNSPGDSGGDKKQLSPEEQQLVNETEGLVLQVVLDYLYGGRGAQGWEYLNGHWPELDRGRARQEILKARMNGILAEINRSTPPAGK